MSFASRLLRCHDCKDYGSVLPPSVFQICLTMCDKFNYPQRIYTPDKFHLLYRPHSYPKEVQGIQLVRHTQHNEGNLQTHGSTDIHMDHSSMPC